MAPRPGHGPSSSTGDVYVRAAGGQQSSRYRAAMSQKAGRVRVAGKNYEVTFEPAGDELADAIDAAYEAT